MATGIAMQADQNRLLQILPEAEYARLQPHLDSISCTVGTTLMHAEAPVPWVYFPQSLIASMVVHDASHMIEASTIGKEGFVGLPALLGSRSLTAMVVQIPGDTWRMPTEVLMGLLPELPELSALFRRYVLSVIDEAAQCAACNRAHPIEKRCAKWLLLIHDRVQRDQFPITHKYLATMLGVRRAGVTIAAGMLQKARIISYVRGKMTILDRARLEASSCTCYATIRRNRERLFDASARKGTGSGPAAF